MNVRLPPYNARSQIQIYVKGTYAYPKRELRISKETYTYAKETCIYIYIYELTPSPMCGTIQIWIWHWNSVRSHTYIYVKGTNTYPRTYTHPKRDVYIRKRNLYVYTYIIIYELTPPPMCRSIHYWILHLDSVRSQCGWNPRVTRPAVTPTWTRP